MELIGWILAFIVAITIHEAAHAFAADKLGDPTARLMGRLSLNPAVHYDKTGTTLLLVLVILRAFGFPIIPFGWAKPVQFDPYNLKNPRRDSALISFAGPASNLIFSLLLAIAFRFIGLNLLLFNIIYPSIILNVSLAVFNLLPLHPLDGGKIFIGLLPKHEAQEADLFLRRYGMLILLFLILPVYQGVSPISMIISPIINFILKIILPSTQFT